MSVTTLTPTTAGARRSDGRHEASRPKEEAGGKKKMILILRRAARASRGAGYWFFLKPRAADRRPSPARSSPWSRSRSTSTDGHYLQLGIALQLGRRRRGGRRQQGAGRRDRPVQRADRSTRSTPAEAARASSRTSSESELEQAYEDEVMDVYFTEFVTQ